MTTRHPSEHHTARTLDRAAAAPLARISGPADLIQAVPFLIGFHPTDSLVLIGLAGLRERTVKVTARVDLTDVDDTAANSTTARQATTRLSDVLRAFARGGATAVTGIVFTTAPHTAAHPAAGRARLPLAHARLAERIVTLADDDGIDLLDVLLVTHDRWWSYQCDQPHCCPPDGTPLQDHISAFVPAAISTGLAPLPDRAALGAQLDPREPMPSRQQIAAAERAHTTTASQPGSPARSEDAIAHALTTAASTAQPEQLPLPEIARLGVALRYYPVRDALWLAIDEQRLDADALWRTLATRLPAPYNAAPLFLVAWSAWRTGNGALANIAAERALASDPGYSAAELLLSAVSLGINPHDMPSLHAH